MKSLRADGLKICCITVVLFCIVLSFLPLESHAAGLLQWLFPLGPKTTKESDPGKSDTIKNFTILKIEPNLKENIINITFTEKCSIDNLRSSLKIFPPVKIHWHNSSLHENSVFIRGEFKAGQDYTIMIPETLECSSRKYVKTLNTFKMPDLQSEIHFEEKETVVERNSRQMIHAGVTNVDELFFQGLQIPPVLIPYALKELSVDNKKIQKTEAPAQRHVKVKEIQPIPPYEKIKETLEKRYKAMQGFLNENQFPQNFLGNFVEDSQLFFPDKERNNPNQFSMPLGFRTQKEKGAVEIIYLKSNKNDQKVEAIARLFRITDLGITYKISNDSLLLWVTSLNTGEPVKDVHLIAFLNDSSLVPIGKTNENGILLIKDLESKQRFYPEEKKTTDLLPVSLKDIEFIASATDNDASYIEIKQNGTVRPDWVTQTQALGDKAQLLKGHVFTERGIYRPGDRVYFKGTVREFKDNNILPPAGSKASFVIINSKNEEVYNNKEDLSEFGTASGTFDVKSYFPLGTYTIAMRFAGGSASTTFEVQEFKAPRHYVEVFFKREKKKDESYINLNKEIELLTCDIYGKYYAGGPVKHGKARWKIYYTSTNFKRKDYADYVFGSVAENEQDLLESGESMLDDKGRLSVSVPITKNVTSGIYGVEVVATVVDFDGRASTETALFQEDPDYLIGISTHENRVKAGDSQVLKIVVVKKDGKRIESGTINVDVMKNEYLYVRKRNESGNIYWDEKEVYRKQISSSLNIENGTSAFDFDFVSGGRYILRFNYKTKDGKEYSSSTMYNVEGYFYGYEYESRERNFERFSVYTEKKEYTPGETIRVYINPHKQISSLLMTMEREGVLQYKTFKLKPGQKFIDIPVEQSFKPNVYISFLGIVSRGDFPLYNGQFDDSAPGFLFGVVNVDIKQEVREMKITVNEGEKELKAEPGAEVRLRISSKDNSGKGVETEMAVCVVDESVLALTRFKTPVLDSLSRFTSPLSVFTGELRQEMLRQTPFGYIRNERLTGGDGMEGGREVSSSKTRKDFRPMAFFSPALRTDKDGKADVTFTLPDTMTSYRVYVVACDKKDKFASFERSLLAVKDFYMEPGTPRFFTKGDKFKFFVSAFNKTNKSSSVGFGIESDGLVKVSAKDAKYSLSAMDRILIPVNGEALKPGVSNLVFSGNFEDKKDRIEIKVPVKSGYIRWDDIVYGTIKNAAKITYAFPEGTSAINWNELNPEEMTAVLTVSGSPFLRMSKALRYLLTYPYGCVEQTSSGVLPLSALRELIAKGLISEINIAETDKFLKPGIERLLSMQTASGGFGYWPGNIQPHPWGTIYAASALTQAKRAGFEIPQEKMDMAMQYLRDTINGEAKTDYAFKGYAAYILALNNSLDPNLFREIYKDFRNMTREGALLLLLAAKTGNYLPAQEITEQTRAVLNREWDNRGYYYFYAYYREPAIALIASTVILQDESVSGRLAKQLLGGVNKQGIWTSTSDTGWALVALAEYFKGKSFSAKPVSVTFRQEGWPDTTALIEPYSVYSYPLEPKSFLKKPEITVFAEGDFDLVYMLSLTFPRVDYAARGFSKGFTIHKKIENTDGAKKIKVGDVVKVKISIEMNDSYNYVVLDDPLPAGLVAINTAIKTEERVGKSKRQEAPEGDEGEYDYWDYETGFYKFVPNYFEIRDDRVLIFKDRAWKGNYEYSYYARAVCEGEFVMPSTKVQLMYEPDTVSFTPMERVVIEARE